MNATIRIAAAGDVHAAEPLRERLTRVFAAIAEDADLVLLAGDLTTHGLPVQAEVLADACAGVAVPVVAVLGNHDHHSGCVDEVHGILRAAGVVVLDRDHVTLELGGLEVGIVGTKVLRRRVRGRRDPGLRRAGSSPDLPRDDARGGGARAGTRCGLWLPKARRAPALRADHRDDRRRARGDLGVPRVGPAGPIGMHRPELVVHGHAHHGAARGAIGTVPVHNVAVHVTGEDFAIFEI